MINKFLIALIALLGYASWAEGADLDSQAVAAFVDKMVAQDGYDKVELVRVMEQAERSDRILKAMSRPAEKSKPWYEYREHFLTDARITNGIKFWTSNADDLAEAANVYGVPAEIIVAIIGVETAYGEITGKDRVVDALSTLAFHYPSGNEKRMKFFQAQLRHLFLMSRERGLDPLSLNGSYAGAMGIPQFMPESYRKYAIDFNGDGQRNIWEDRSDAIGSVANYLKSHGWSRGESIVVAASVPANGVGDLLTKSAKPHLALSKFARLGVMTLEPIEDQDAALFTLEGETSLEYWLALNNFYAIMKYNPRTKYAMAVVVLAEAIRNVRLVASL